MQVCRVHVSYEMTACVQDSRQCKCKSSTPNQAICCRVRLMSTNKELEIFNIILVQI